MKQKTTHLPIFLIHLDVFNPGNKEQHTNILLWSYYCFNQIKFGLQQVTYTMCNCTSLNYILIMPQTKNATEQFGF